MGNLIPNATSLEMAKKILEHLVYNLYIVWETVGIV